MDISRAVVISVATWRLTRMLVHESGPLNVFRRIRDEAGIMEDDDGFRIVPDDGRVGTMLGCMWCTSVWVAGALVLMDRKVPLVANILAVSGAGMLVEERIYGKG